MVDCGYCFYLEVHGKQFCIQPSFGRSHETSLVLILQQQLQQPDQGMSGGSGTSIQQFGFLSSTAIFFKIGIFCTCWHLFGSSVGLVQHIKLI